MTRYIAFLRAINVGGRTVKMDRLRALFKELGFSNVETFIASGNVIFTSPDRDSEALERDIEVHLLETLGYTVDTFIRSAPELAGVATLQPFGPAEPAEGSYVYVAFLKTPLAAERQQQLSIFNGVVDHILVHNCEIHLLFRTTMTESGFSGALLEKTIGMPATMRNLNTVQRLTAKYPADR